MKNHTLLLGVEETDEEPRRARCLAPLPQCEDLARRLADACEDVIEPRLPIVEAKAFPAAEGDSSGIVVMRVGRSAAGPHRLVSDGQFYYRRGERSVKMTVREVRDAVLELARRADAIDEKFRSRRKEDRQAIERGIANADTPGAQGMLVRLTALPISWFPISNLTQQPELWWRGDEHDFPVSGRIMRAAYPAREFAQWPRVSLRSLRYSDGRFERALTAEGIIDASVMRVRFPQPGRVLDRVDTLYWTWIVSLLCGVLAQIEHLRHSLAADGAEFGLQLAVEASVPLNPAWTEHEWTARPADFKDVEFPILPVGSRATFDEVVNVVLRDIANHCGSTFESPVECDWSRLLPGASRSDSRN